MIHVPKSDLFLPRIISIPQREKVKTLTANIGDSRTGVSDVKTFIDGMRSSRDTKMKEMNDLKTKLKDQNQRLLDVTQEKAQLESKNKARAAAIEAADGEENPELTEFEYKKIEKEKEVVLLRENFEAVKEKVKASLFFLFLIISSFFFCLILFFGRRLPPATGTTMSKPNFNCIERIWRKSSSPAKHSMITSTRREEKSKRKSRNESVNLQIRIMRGDPKILWKVSSFCRKKNMSEMIQDRFRFLTGADGAADAAGATAVAAGSGDAGDVVRYVALYDYPGASADELSFKVGDIILVSSNQNADPGWLGGEFEGKVGWFPEAYAEREDASAAAAATLAADSVAPEAAVSADAPAAVDAMLPVTVETGKVLFDWSNPDGTFKMEQGQEVEVWRTDVDGWSLGRVNGQNGYDTKRTIFMESMLS